MRNSKLKKINCPNCQDSFNWKYFGQSFFDFLGIYFISEILFWGIAILLFTFISSLDDFVTAYAISMMVLLGGLIIFANKIPIYKCMKCNKWYSTAKLEMEYKKFNKI